MGAALWTWHEVLGNPRTARKLAPGLGKQWSDAELQVLVAELKLPHTVVDPVDAAAQDLADGKVIGWFQGRFEWGPRALGFRSILADPTRAETKDRINEKIKFREPFRPFAPSVAAGHEARYFDIPAGGDALAEWMLLVAPTTTDALPAVTHVDGTARVHVVHAEANPRYHALIERFGALSGHPVVLNTSFNLKGEPIVNSPVHAAATFARSGLDVLYLGPCRVVR